MKKLIAILMVLAVLCSLTVTAMAEAKTTEEEVAEYVWDEEMESDAAEIDEDATFVQIGDWNLCMWLPSVFSEYDLGEEAAEEGILTYLAPDDLSAGIMIYLYDNEEGYTDLEDVQADLVEGGYEDAEIVIINDIQAVMYTDEETDTINVIYLLLDSDEMLVFSFSPASDEDFLAVAYYMICSLQEFEEE